MDMPLCMELLTQLTAHMTAALTDMVSCSGCSAMLEALLVKSTVRLMAMDMNDVLALHICKVSTVLRGNMSDSSIMESTQMENA